MEHDFIRCPDEEQYGIPRVWRHEEATDYVRCWVQKTKYGNWEMHRRITMPDNTDLSRYKGSPTFVDKEAAIAAAEEWMATYSKQRRIDHSN